MTAELYGGPRDGAIVKTGLHVTLHSGSYIEIPFRCPVPSLFQNAATAVPVSTEALAVYEVVLGWKRHGRQMFRYVAWRKP